MSGTLYMSMPPLLPSLVALTPLSGVIFIMYDMSMISPFTVFPYNERYVWSRLRLAEVATMMVTTISTLNVSSQRCYFMAYRTHINIDEIE